MGEMLGNEGHDMRFVILRGEMGRALSAVARPLKLKNIDTCF